MKKTALFRRVRKGNRAGQIVSIKGCLVLLGFLGTAVPVLGQWPQGRAPQPRVAVRSVIGSWFETFDAVPNRPSSSNSADVLAPGELQIEYGFSREWSAAGERQNLLGGELQFGAFRNLELRWGGNPLVENSIGISNERGFGDQYFAAQALLRRESENAPALALSYAVKVPTGDESRRLGSGRFDHSFTVLASKEIRHITADFNAGYKLVGRTGEEGYDQNGFVILAFSRSLYGPLTGIAEISKETRLGSEPAFATTLLGLSYRLRRSFVLDAAFDAGITNGAPHKRILFGLTYAFARLYGRGSD